MDLKELKYGNPTQEQYEIIGHNTPLSVLFEQLSKITPPENDSDLVRSELNTIVDYLKIINDSDNEEFLLRYKAYDKALVQTLSSMFKAKGVDILGYAEEVIKDISALIYQLKYHHQRPRPYQLAYYKKLKLFPHKSDTALSPSFPSGHTVQAYVLLNVISSKNPELTSFCENLLTDIANSRLYLGLHFPSDNDYAITVGEAIIKNREFSKKHNI